MNIRKYKKVSIFAVMLVLIAGICCLFYKNKNSPRKSLIMGTSADFPPFEFLKDGNVIGIDVEIAKKIAKKRNVNLEVKDISFNSLILELKNETIDFIASGMTKTEERSKSIDFSDSYFTAFQKIVVKNGNDIKCSDDIKNKRIGVQLGTTGDIYCTDQKLGDIMRYDKYTEAITALSKGIIDVLVVDGFTGDAIVKKNNDLRVIPESLTEESYCMGLKKGNEDLLNSINEAIFEMKQSGEMDEIINSYMNSSEDDHPKSNSKFLNSEHWNYVLQGLSVTLKITFFSMIIGILLGTLASSLKIISDLNKKLSFLGILVNFYTTIIRGTPVIVQLFIIFYAMLSGLSKNPIIAAIITLGINSGAYVCEHIRAGISAIDEGQFEAGISLGISEKTLMSKIIIPQAIKNIIPSLAGEGISLLKETAVVGFIGVMDLSLAGKKITSVTFDPVFPLFIVALIYLILVVGLTFLLNKIERKMKNDTN